MPLLDACARCAVPKASFTKISPSRAKAAANLSSFFSSPLSNLTFSKRRIPPGGKAATASSTSSPTTVSLLRTSHPRRRDNCSATGSIRSFSTTLPLGRPRCEARIILHPLSMRYFIVGNAERILVSSITLPSSERGTLKSTRTKTLFPSIGISFMLSLDKPLYTSREIL